MKIAIAALLVGSAAAFAPISQSAFRVNSLSAVPATGVEGKPAKSAEEDLELTREVILSYIEGGNGDDAPAEEADEE